jgi:hypothetical protein
MDPNQQSPIEQNPIPQQPVNKTPRSGNKWKLILMVIILLIIVGGGAYLLGAKQSKLIIQNKQATVTPTIVQQITTNNQKRVCPSYGSLPKKEYLPTYTVRQGDSPLLIASTQLGNSGRLQEFITLNSDNYPNLKNNSFLEVGWKMVLPPTFVKESSGQIYITSGQIIDDSQQRWWIMDSPDAGGSFGVVVDKNTKVPNGLTLKRGDCVILIYDREGISGATALSLQKQITPTIAQSTPFQTLDQTANWKTYVNTQNYYSFKYSSALFTIQENGSRTRLLEGMGYGFEVNVIQTTDTMENWLIKEKNSGQFPDSSWKSTQSTFQSYPALLLQSLPNTMQAAMDVIIVENNNRIYEISFNKEVSDKTVVDQILTTFKFTN